MKKDTPNFTFATTPDTNVPFSALLKPIKGQPMQWFRITNQDEVLALRDFLVVAYPPTPVVTVVAQPK